ncbi:four-carbon acid sugar kinase family protein, partial [bacterium]|nr:four-carbon acid sugar kinase family protein [bacterium]
MVGAPFLRRYVAFGNLFARAGDITYRLDRHPTMSNHPITPMTEGDLRLHLVQPFLLLS